MEILGFVTTLICTLVANTAHAGDYDYGQVIAKSLLFYEAQRCGKLPSSNRIPWRGDSMLNDKDDTVDLTGGYFDAGDFVKFQLPMAWSMTVLAWGAIDFADGYTAAEQTSALLDALKWGTDYFIKAHPSDNVLYVQVGDGNADHASWGRPEDWTAARPTYKITTLAPGSDVAGETAAALAAASILFKCSNPTYYSILLDHSKQLYNFAKNYRGVYSVSVPAAASFYNSYQYQDELVWASAWLYRATGESIYLAEAKQFYVDFNMEERPDGFDWDNKRAGIYVLLARLTGDQMYKTAVQTFCDYSINSAPKTPKNLLYVRQWGPLRYAANAAFVCLQAASLGINTTAYNKFAKNQIDYMLGDSGRSFVVGYGQNSPKSPHHRSSSCPLRPTACGWNEYNSASPNPQVLNGALIGGPDDKDGYEDSRQDYTKNEVTTDYNAGFQSALAALKSLQSPNKSG